MTIDKKYIELLATTVPMKSNKWLKRIALLSFMIFFVGLFFVANALFRPITSETDKNQAVKAMNISLVVSTAGIVAAGVTGFFMKKERDRNRKAFMNFYENYGDLPPWPKDQVIL